MDKLTRKHYFCPKCKWSINGKCNYPGLCADFNQYQQDNSALKEEIRKLKKAIKALSKEVDALKNQIGGETND